MTDSISYTPEEVAKILKISRFTVYELIKRGELTAYRIGRKVRVEPADLEQYKLKAKGCPKVTANNKPRPVESHFSPEEGLIICGQDIVLDSLTRHLERKMPQVRFLRSYIGSMDGLSALYKGNVNVASAHLWDGDLDQYNIPFVRHMLPGQSVAIFNLVYRMAGFYVAKGNPKEVADWNDLSRGDIQLINREKGSGARVLLDEKLRQLKIDYRSISGYDLTETSHLAVASRVARGEADVSIGIEKAALQVKDIDFIPLIKERYDLIIRKEDLEKAHFQLFLEVLSSPEFRKEVEGMGGYDISQMGELIAEI